MDDTAHRSRYHAHSSMRSIALSRPQPTGTEVFRSRGRHPNEEARARHEVTKARIAAAEARLAVAQRPLMYPVEQCQKHHLPRRIEADGFSP